MGHNSGNLRAVPPTQLDGTITGIIFIVIVAVLALATLIALIFWAARQKPT
jgi:cobalamin biosynthesis Mg chelatase CobN